MRIIAVVLAFVFLWLSGCNSSSGRRTTDSSVTPLPPRFPPPATAPTPSLSCQYLYQSQMVNDPSCTKNFATPRAGAGVLGHDFCFARLWKISMATGAVLMPRPVLWRLSRVFIPCFIAEVVPAAVMTVVTAAVMKTLKPAPMTNTAVPAFPMKTGLKNPFFK